VSLQVGNFNTFTPRLIQAVRAKTLGSHVALRRKFFGPVSATDPFKSLKDSASLVACTRTKIFWLGMQIFLSNFISGGLLGHLGPLHLALGPNC